MLPCPLASKKRAPGTQVSGRHRTWEHRPPWPLGNRNPVENVVGLCQCLAACGQSQEILQPQAVGSFWLKRRGDGKTRARGLGGPHPEGCIEIAWPDPGGLWGQRSFRKCLSCHSDTSALAKLNNRTHPHHTLAACRMGYPDLQAGAPCSPNLKRYSG